MHFLKSSDVAKQQFILVKHVSNLLMWKGNLDNFSCYNKFSASTTNRHLNTCTRLNMCQKRFIYNSTIRKVLLSKNCAINTYRRCFGTKINGFDPTTIFSLSSGHGKCGVALIRVSGSKVKDIVGSMIPKGIHVPQRKAVLSKILDPESKEPIDKGLVLYFHGPHSFTGEDCLEFHIHGGLAVISSLLAALHKIPDCKQAEPGEFTKRAFMNGKLDLTEVEGLGDLIHVETEVQRKQAMRQMDGDLSHLYSQWRTAIIKCVADLEAFIDFSEDQHIGDEVISTVKDMVYQLKKAIRAHVDDKRRGERLRDGVHVTILGEPNVGKSSLLNTICQRPVAIVTEIPGTTRDIVETAVNLDGYPILISDTAGLRETQDIVEKEGVARAVKRARHSDIRIFMFDSIKHIYGLDTKLNKPDLGQQIMMLINTLLEGDQISEKCNHDAERSDQVHPAVEMWHQSKEIQIEMDNTIILLNKTDLLPPNKIQTLIEDFEVFTETNNDEGIEERTLSFDTNEHQTNTMCSVGGSGDRNKSSDPASNDGTCTRFIPYLDGCLSVCCISCVTGEGLENFIQVLRDKVVDMCGNPLVGHPSITQTRHRSHLIKCLENLDQFDHLIAADDIVLASEYLRRALREIGRITGNISSEEILDVIFKDFCIGK